MADVRFAVEVLEGDEWVRCVREDLLDDLDGDVDRLPPAIFETHAEAETFIGTLRGMMHCGGGDTRFHVVGVRS